jgi:hypothetical protein
MLAAYTGPAMATIRHSFTETTITAHRDVVEAMRTMPRLTFVVAVLIVLQVALQLAAASVIPRTSLLGRDIVAIFYYALFTPFFIAVHRFIILGEITREYRLDWRDRRFQLFFGWAFVAFLLSRIPAVAMHLPKNSPIQFLVLASVIAMWVIFVRSTILFPAIAVDAPGATPRRAFDDTRGHGWYIFFVYLLPFIPSLLIGLLIGRAVTILMPGAGYVVYLVLAGVMGMLWLTLAVVIASRLYLGLGDRLNREA